MYDIFCFKVDVKYVEIEEQKKRMKELASKLRLNAPRTTLYKKEKAKKREERSSFLCKIL